MKRDRADLAPGLRRRINALVEAESVGHLKSLDPLGVWHELKGDMRGLWAGKLTANWRLIVRPEGSAAGVASVTVTVAEVTDYH